MEILLVECFGDVRGALQEVIARAGFAFDRVNTVDNAMDAVRGNRYAAILVCEDLASGESLTFVAKIRADGNSTPIIILAMYIDLDQKIASLEAGADDYLICPFASEGTTRQD
jgi:two-component system, OmpR family, response regulator